MLIDSGSIKDLMGLMNLTQLREFVRTNQLRNKVKHFSTLKKPQLIEGILKVIPGNRDDRLNMLHLMNDTQLRNFIRNNGLKRDVRGFIKMDRNQLIKALSVPEDDDTSSSEDKEDNIETEPIEKMVIGKSPKESKESKSTKDKVQIDVRAKFYSKLGGEEFLKQLFKVRGGSDGKTMVVPKGIRLNAKKVDRLGKVMRTDTIPKGEYLSIYPMRSYGNPKD